MTAVRLSAAAGSLLGIFILILDSKTALSGAVEGITLCIQTVIPALFPFFLCSSVLTISTLGTGIKLLEPLRKLFSLPMGTGSLLIPAFFGGYPVGAQCVADAWRGGQLSKEDSERMLGFCSNAGPSFLFGIIGHMFPQRHIPWLLWGIHILSAWMVSRIYPPKNKKAVIAGSDRSFGQVMYASVKTMGTVCGWIVLFRIVIAFLNRWFMWLIPPNLQVLITGILELANGCSDLYRIPNPSVRFLICSIMLSLGGICVTLQTLSVTHGLSIKIYCRGKGLQCLFSMLLSVGIVYNLWALPLGLILFFCYFSGKTKNTGSNPKKAVV